MKGCTKEFSSFRESEDVNQQELQLITQNHLYLLNDKPVQSQVLLSGEVVVRMPEAAFHILLGNLIKNAFASTEQGGGDH